MDSKTLLLPSDSQLKAIYYSPHELSLDTLLTNDTSAKEMGQNGFNAVIGKYNWHNEEKKLFNIYRELE
jgi:hypothetical protein